MKICAFGSGSNDIAQSYRETCFELGKKLAQKGHTLVFGGSKNGLMGDIGQGFRAGEGHIIGVIPEILNDPNRYHKDVNELIITQDIVDRKLKMIDLADGYVILPGGVGTYDEMFEIIVRNELGYESKPIIFFNYLGYYDTLLKFLDETYEKGFMPKMIYDLYKVANSIEEVLALFEGK